MARFIIAKVFCIIFGLCCAAISPWTCASNATDVLALLTFRAAIIDPLGSLKSWNQSSEYCSWEGISCGSKHPNRVVVINLTSRGLVGTLSPHIGNLSFLTVIALGNNNFYGPIPQEIGRLRRLEHVEFSSNSFVGEIPRNISQYPSLVFLDLIDNRFSGSIPVELGSLLNLEVLSLGKNNLSGSIPPFLGNLTSLTKLSLAMCDFRGEIPESLAQLGRLNFLSLSGNRLTGRIPSGLFNISTIFAFDVSVNELQGVIPGDIGLTLPNLKNLHLGRNQFTGELPVSLANATSLETLFSAFNRFKGPIPRELGRLSNLQGFVIKSNFIQDDLSFITSLTNCTNLRTLEFGINPLKGSLPDSLCNLSRRLEHLDISGSQIHGNIPSDVGNLVGLDYLVIYDTNLEGPIPFSIGKLSNLGILLLIGNRLADEIPRSFGNLTLLTELNLQENNLSGSIPQSLGNCTRLQSLGIGYNFLDGSIPPQIMRLSSISSYLHLSYNALTGSIPIEVGALKHLTDLDLSYNRLSGLIPNSLSGCTSLESLQLQDNLLQGEIPQGLSALKGLQDMDLSRNNFSGKIPVFFTRLNLVNLNLSFNRFNGEVPNQGVFGNKTALSIEGNAELCGGILELKLPPCSAMKSSKKPLPTLLKIIIPTLASVGLCVTLCACIFIRIYRPKFFMKKQSSSGINGPLFMRLSYGDLLKATGNFSGDNLVGAGRFGSVYRGILEDGKTMVAIKVLNLLVKGASKSFIAECIALKGTRHRNLLKLLSVCESIDFQRSEFKALVYEFMSNGSLEDMLYPNKEKEEEHDAEFQSLNMFQRLEIAIDIAHALEYLHTGTGSPIIHGDLKPRNVLLDDNMTAHVGDFGLSKKVSDMLESPESSNTIGIKGTIGYVPPEYGTSNSVSIKGDVYSFGIILLEMFTGKRPTDEAFDENLNLHDFVTSALPNHVTEIIDPIILEGHDMNNKLKECMTSILSIGVACSSKAPTDRMCMTDVVRGLCKMRVDYMSRT